MRDSHDDPRSRILAEAKQVFASRGFRGGSLNDIAVRSGYTRAGLLHYFPNKEAILLGLLEQRDVELGELTASDESASQGIFELLEGLDESVRVVKGDRELVQLAHVLTAEVGGGEHPARDWVASRYEALRGNLVRAINVSVERGELAPEVPAELLATVILGVFEGVEAQWLIDGSIDLLRAHKLLINMLEGMRGEGQ